MSIRSHNSVGQGPSQLTSQVCAITGAQSGDTLVALIACSSTRTVSSVTDDQGNSWSQVSNAVNSGQGYTTDIWVAKNVKAATTTSVTVTLSGQALLNFGVAVYDLTGGAVVQAGSTSDGVATTPFNGPSLTSAIAGVFLAIVVDSASTLSVASPWSLDETMSNSNSLNTDYAVSLAASGTQQPVFTLTGVSAPQVCSGVVLASSSPDPGTGGEYHVIQARMRIPAKEAPPVTLQAIRKLINTPAGRRK